MTYYEPLFKGLKIDDQTSIAMMALLDRAGLRQKVGTNVRAMMLEELGPLQLTKHFQQGQGKILEHMGVFDKNMQFKWNLPNGGVDFLGMLHGVAHWAIAQEKAGTPNSVVAEDIYGALGKQGGTIGSLMADPQMLKILSGILDYLHNREVSLVAGERNRQDSIVYQAGRMWSNFQAVMTELGYRATWASGALKDVADGLHNVQEWLHEHRTGHGQLAGGSYCGQGATACGHDGGWGGSGGNGGSGGTRWRRRRHHLYIRLWIRAASADLTATSRTYGRIASMTLSTLRNSLEAMKRS